MSGSVEKNVKNNIEYIKRHKFYEFIKEMVFLVLGAYLISLGISMFLLPHKLTTGGASGIATILYYISNIPMGMTIMIINIPLFIVSLAKLGMKFSIKTIISTVLLSVFLQVFKYDTILTRNISDLFTACIFGGLITGIGLSLTFKSGASSGGSDLLAQIIYRLTSIQSLSQILLAIEVVIISGLIIVFQDINLGLYSIISLFISTKVIDVMFEGIYYTKVATIITNKPEQITSAILNDLQRGATITNTIGAHSGQENTTITCIITRPQIAKLKSIIRENDKKAVMYIATANEVIGSGFKDI